MYTPHLLYLKKIPLRHNRVAKNLPANAGDITDAGSIPGLGRSPGEGNGIHSSTLALKTRLTEEPGRLQSKGSQINH